MAQPASAAANQSAATSSPRVKYSEALLTTATPASPDQPYTNAAGQDIALHVLESTLIGGDVSAQTNQLIHKQLDDASAQNTSPSDMLNILTALVMGSPEFQLR